ncbi:MAG: cobalt-precorrin-6A reductase [Mycobacteriaceae bacterium]
MMKILILGGTSEARGLAAALHERKDTMVLSSLAGRVSNPLLPVGEVRLGGFGGLQNLTNWLQSNNFDAIIDATHPFARKITGSAFIAAEQSRIAHLVLRRPAWTKAQDDNWHEVDSLPAAAELLPEIGSRVFLTTGRQGLSDFSAQNSVFAHRKIHFVIRVVDPPDGPIPVNSLIIRDRGPYDVVSETALMLKHGIDVLVTKNSGGTMTKAKLLAAKKLAIPVIVIRRPALPEGVVSTTSIAGALAWLDQLG